MNLTKTQRADVERHRRGGCTRLDCHILRAYTRPWQLRRVYLDPNEVQYRWLLTYEPAGSSDEEICGPYYERMFYGYGYALSIMRTKMREQQRSYAASVGVAYRL